MNSALRARWLASSEVIGKYYSPSSNQKDKTERINFNFCPFFGILPEIS